MLAIVVCAGAPSTARAQQFRLGPADIADSAALARAMPRLAREVSARYRARDRATFLDNSFPLRIVEGDYAGAAKSIAALRALRLRSDATPRARAAKVQYEIYAKAMARRAGDGYADALRDVFRETLGRMDDQTAASAMRLFAFTARDVQGQLDAALGERGKATSIALGDALALLRTYQVVQAYRSFDGIVLALVTEDDRRRYVIQMNVQVPTADGATVCALIVRPRTGPPRLPALLQFTIYADSALTYHQARLTAANQYASIMGFTRGKACSPQKTEPYVHDGADAAALIEWIAKQPWSDGRVGMYGGSYSGFTAWAAAKQMPSALKAIMVGAPVAPGIDVPMEGNVFWNFVYPWPFYTTNTKALDDATYNDNARWNRLYREWYVTGRAYRDLDKIDGTPNPVFDAWVAHPTYDAYWQAMIPFEREFSTIRIPVLQTAGYYFGGPGAAVYYLTQHSAYNPSAEHYLVIGPYDHVQAQRGVVGALGDTASLIFGYRIDPVARIDIVADLRYQWFDYVLKGAPRPALLRDKVNYEVVNANVWRHAPSVRAMSTGSLRLYLSAEHAGGAHRLSRTMPSRDTSVVLEVNLADRSDADRVAPGGGVSDTVVDTWNSLEFVSDPITTPTELAGLFSGQLDFVANKRDFDFGISLFELTPKGEYVQLPPYWSRASHVASLRTRRLLTPGKREQVKFTSVRLMGHRLGAGSRLVAVLSVLRSSAQEINYGTGKAVSEETIADAGAPLTISWFADSFIDLPVRR
jgi:uncharacterized protein